MTERLIITEYSGAAGDRVGRAVTLEGAMRAAMIRLVHNEYNRAVIFDCRFGSKAKAIVMTRSLGIVQAVWTKAPRWTRKAKK
jgi:hypothetical protein